MGTDDEVVSIDKYNKYHQVLCVIPCDLLKLQLNCSWSKLLSLLIIEQRFNSDYQVDIVMSGTSVVLELGAG